MREGKLSLYYVDKDINGVQNDMPFDYCLILTLVRKQDNNPLSNQGQAFAFNIIDGTLKYKCFSGIGGSRDFPWKTVSLTQ